MAKLKVPGPKYSGNGNGTLSATKRKLFQLHLHLLQKFSGPKLLIKSFSGLQNALKENLSGFGYEIFDL